MRELLTDGSKRGYVVRKPPRLAGSPRIERSVPALVVTAMFNAVTRGNVHPQLKRSSPPSIIAISGLFG